jgi:hypothetical protein
METLLPSRTIPDSSLGEPSQMHALQRVRDANFASLCSYHNGGFADYSLDSVCDDTHNTTFYAAFAKSKVRMSSQGPFASSRDSF